MGLREWIKGKSSSDSYDAQVRHHLWVDLRVQSNPQLDPRAAFFDEHIGSNKANGVHPLAASIQIATINLTALLQGNSQEQSQAFKLLIPYRMQLNLAVIKKIISEQEASYYESLIRKFSMDALLNGNEESD